MSAMTENAMTVSGVDAPRREGAGRLLAIAMKRAWRHRVLLLAAIGVGAVVGTFRALVIPNQYRSVGKLFVRPGVRDTFSPDAVISGVGGTSRITGVREAVQNELQVLAIPDLFDKIAQRVGVDVVLAPYDPAADSGGEVPWHTALSHSFQSWWFAAESGAQTDIAVGRAELASLILQNNIAIVPEIGASVIAIEYVSHSPERARVIVNAALDCAQEVHGEVFDKMLSVARMEEQGKSFEQAAVTADEALRAFRKEHDIYDYESQLEAQQTGIAAIEREIEAVDLEVASRQSERLAVEKQLKDTKPTQVRLGSQTWIANPEHAMQMQVVTALNSLLIAAQVEKGPTAEQRVKDIQDLLQTRERQLLQTEQLLKSAGIEEENPLYVRFEERLRDANVQLEVLAAKRAKLLEQIGRAREELRALDLLSSNLRRLENDARQTRNQADLFAQSITNLRTVQRLEQMNLSNVSVMHYGTLEATKISPQRGRMVVLGAFGGGVVGAVLALLLTLLDRRVRMREDLVGMGMASDGVLVSDDRRVDGVGDWVLPHSLALIRHDIAKFWATLPYDRRSTESLRIAFVPAGDGAEVGRAAAALAVGLAAHGGERVAYVASTEGPTWLAQRLGLTVRRGWHEVLRGDIPLEQALLETPIPGLSYLSAGAIGNAVPHPMAGPGFVALLDKLAVTNRFVIVELPDLAKRPEGRSVLGVIDAAMLVVRAEVSEKAAVRHAMAAVAVAGARLLGGVLQGPQSEPQPRAT